ncbi:MAG TPA: maleylpyruvate isomerase family mycothiol-dependent enzyme [Intrasporangiaceae bacterium]|nr:maleylpyruvate isomerase family mycothiol-dependent enzyme [Intrasporangiaceae bacterium]
MIDRRSIIAAESERFAAALATADPTVPVPTCPDWTALDLLSHLTQVHQFWAAVIGERLTGPQAGEFEENQEPLPQDPQRLQQLRRQATADLLAALDSRDPGEWAWSWFEPDQSVDFTWRMQTHEATMHRVDAELTAGQDISPIDPDIAGDGVDHVLDVMWNWAPADADRVRSGVVELRATDTGRTWQVGTVRWTGQAWGQTFTDHPTGERVEGQAPDATISGTAEDLDLLVWTRADRGLTREGDPRILAEFQAIIDAGHL